MRTDRRGGRGPSYGEHGERPLARKLTSAAAAVAIHLPVPDGLAEPLGVIVDDQRPVPCGVTERLFRSPEAAARVLAAAASIADVDPFGSLEEAVHAVGIAGLRDACARTGTYAAFGISPGPAGMRDLAFATRSAHVAQVGEAVCRITGADDMAAGARTAGLLHDIGLAVIAAAPVGLAGTGHRGYRRLVDLPLCDHPALGASLAKRWALHDDIIAAIRHHEDPLPPAGRLGRAVWLAVRVVEARLGIVSGDELRSAAAHFGLAPELPARMAMHTFPDPDRIPGTPGGVASRTSSAARPCR